MTSPTKLQFWAAKQVLRYLVETRDFGIQYKNKGEQKLEGFVDNNQCGDVHDREST